MTMVPASEQEAVLAALGLNARDPKVQALALVAGRYGLDLILKHVFLIQGTVYVSHAGLLHLAHTSGDLDGIEVELAEDDQKYVATARVYRKSMSKPFTYTDECLKAEKVQSPRKRAITRAERNALRRAFDVGVDVYEEQREMPVVMSPEAPALPGEEPSVDYRPAVILCRELKMPDDLRHSLAHYTTGRTESVKEMTQEEFDAFMSLLRSFKDGVIPNTFPNGLKQEVVDWLAQSVSETKTQK